MEPVTVGVIVAALVAKALDRTGDEAVDVASSALGRLVGAVRERFSKSGPEDQATLTGVETAPDSPKKIEGLAKALERQVTEYGEFRAELEMLVGEAQAAGVDVKSIAQTAIGDNNVQIADVSHSSISVKTGS
jgi:hypothetical protein